jgi:hypothetical protein
VPPVSFLQPDGTPTLIPVNPLTRQPLKTVHREESANFGQLTAYDAFLDGTLRLTRGLRLTAGVRGTYEDVANGFETRGDATARQPGRPARRRAQQPVRPHRRAAHRHRHLPLDGRAAVANYLTVGGTNLFASVSRGRRPNVVNVTVGALPRGQTRRPTVVNTLSDEQVTSYETGIKTAASPGGWRSRSTATTTTTPTSRRRSSRSTRRGSRSRSRSTRATPSPTAARRPCARS